MKTTIKITGVLTAVAFIMAIPVINQMLFVLLLSAFIGLLSWQTIYELSWGDIWLANIAFSITFCGIAYYVSVELLKLFN